MRRIRELAVVALSVWTVGKVEVTAENDDDQNVEPERAIIDFAPGHGYRNPTKSPSIVNTIQPTVTLTGSPSLRPTTLSPSHLPTDPPTDSIPTEVPSSPAPTLPPTGWYNIDNAFRPTSLPTASGCVTQESDLTDCPLTDSCDNCVSQALSGESFEECSALETYVCGVLSYACATYCSTCEAELEAFLTCALRQRLGCSIECST